MQANLLKSIRGAYQRRTFLDQVERSTRQAREWILGVNTAIFDPTIRYYREARGLEISRPEALARALNKQRHKDMWFQRERRSVEDIRQFYQEADVYPFRQPYNKRLGGYRWYAELVRHIPRPAILEYGCGSAVLTEYLLARCPQARFSVADIPSATLEFVKWKKKAYQLPYEILTIGTGRDGIPLQSEYDLIICQDVLEHTPNPLEIVSAFVEHLSVGGVLVLDFLNAPGGENLPAAVEQREAVKELLRTRLTPLKAIDDGGGNNGLYVKDGPGSARPRGRQPVSEPATAVLAP
jgi:2-polyprenyl-3-methyl-5-hydroxy-6-metoxy-1,4-benzoquinol methylase